MEFRTPWADLRHSCLSAKDQRIRSIVDDSGFSDAPNVIASSFKALHSSSCSFHLAPIWGVGIADFRANIDCEVGALMTSSARSCPTPLADYPREWRFHRGRSNSVQASSRSSAAKGVVAGAAMAPKLWHSQTDQQTVIPDSQGHEFFSGSTSLSVPSRQEPALDWL